MEKENFFTKAIPETEGISSRAILRLLTRLQEREFCIHGMMILRKGKVLAEAYAPPFSLDVCHRMYSITKSFTALGIGCLVQEGKVHLEDPIVSFFQDQKPIEGFHPYLLRTTVRDLLRMTTPFSCTSYRFPNKRLRTPEKWLQTFFTVKPDHLPGTVFGYDTAGTYVLGALIERLSGRPILDYLRFAFLDKIGFSKEAQCLKSPEGISHGGSSLVCTLRDLARVAVLCLNGGIWDGEQLLPANYLKDATSFQTNTNMMSNGVDMRQGYGYYFWRCRHNGFFMYGMGGQLALCLPEKDLIFLTMGDTQWQEDWLQEYFSAFWEEIYDTLIDAPLPEDLEGNRLLEKKIQEMKIPTIPGVQDHPNAMRINGKIYCIEKENSMNLQTVCLFFKGKSGEFHYKKYDKNYQINFEIGNFIRGKFPDYPQDYLCSAAWQKDGSLILLCYIIGDYLGSLHIQFFFTQNGEITIQMKKVAEDFLMDYEGITNGWDMETMH